MIILYTIGFILALTIFHFVGKFAFFVARKWDIDLGYYVLRNYAGSILFFFILYFLVVSVSGFEGLISTL